MKTLISITTCVFMMVFNCSCGKKESAPQKQLATLSTIGGTNITDRSFTAGGSITSDGGSAIISRGICYGNSENPTLVNDVVATGSGIGDFTCTVDGLSMNKTSYVRAYATNDIGTSYGEQKIITTKAFVNNGTAVDIDGTSYNRILIGSQDWIQENLNVSHYRNGDLIPQVQDLNDFFFLTTGAWCYYENSSFFGTTYRKLYNWYAVNDPRGLAPVGWHIPTRSEWAALCDYLGGIDVAGGKLKQTGTALWASPNLGATNSSGFTGLPGGTASTYFGSEGQNAVWWGSDTTGLTYAGQFYSFAWCAYAGAPYVRAYIDSFPKYTGLSIRCIKD